MSILGRIYKDSVKIVCTLCEDWSGIVPTQLGEDYNTDRLIAFKMKGPTMSEPSKSDRELQEIIKSAKALGVEMDEEEALQ